MTAELRSEAETPKTQAIYHSVENSVFKRKIGILKNLPEQRARVCYLFRLPTEVVLTQNNKFFRVWLCRNRWSRSFFLIKIHGFSRYRTISHHISTMHAWMMEKWSKMIGNWWRNIENHDNRDSEKLQKQVVTRPYVTKTEGFEVFLTL